MEELFLDFYLRFENFIEYDAVKKIQNGECKTAIHNKN